MARRSTIAAAVIQGGLPLAMLIGLPLIGLILAGHDPAPYLELPPVTRFVRHAGFSMPGFVFFGVTDLLLAGLMVGAVICGWRQTRTPVPAPAATGGRFPWWGWAGLGFCLFTWVLAWKRFAWFWLFQPHTFLPIWAGFILAVNALTVKRSGSCLLVRRPLRFMLLFPVSAVFWWLFEFLNRFVQNWYYTGIEGMGPGEYSYYSSLAFTTVLPGVLSVSELLHSVPALGRGLSRCRPVHLPATRLIPVTLLVISGAGLALIGIYPDQLFALLWVAPLFIVLSTQMLSGRCLVLDSVKQGDLRRLVVPAAAALICGFFWELWNAHSLARWTYTIPFVQRLHLFEMPLLGYGGYPPFGLICFLVAVPIIGDLFARDESPPNEA
jgi:hypothetical protein